MPLMPATAITAATKPASTPAASPSVIQSPATTKHLRQQAAHETTITLNRLNNSTVTFTPDPDILLACEDQAKSQQLSLAAWFQQTLNDALRSYLGI